MFFYLLLTIFIILTYLKFIYHIVFQKKDPEDEEISIPPMKNIINKNFIIIYKFEDKKKVTIELYSCKDNSIEELKKFETIKKTFESLESEIETLLVEIYKKEKEIDDFKTQSVSKLNP
jgi:hypothetical protein